jgi:exosortase
MSLELTLERTVPSLVMSRVRERLLAVKPLAAPIGLFLLVFAPLLVLRGRTLLDRPHLSAFPMAMIAGVVLASKAVQNLGPLEAGQWKRSRITLWVAGALVFVGAIFAWPSLGGVAAIMTVLAIAYGLGGKTLSRAILPAVMFVAVAVLAPVGLELWLIARLQTLATQWAAPVLDTLGVIHLTEGNVIRILSRPLLVEQACSGASSLYAGIGVTLFYVLWNSRGLIPGTILLMAAVCWVVLGNIVRIVAVVYAEATWGIDLASGWRHELWGFAIFAAVMGLTLSTDKLLQFLGALTTMRIFRPPHWEIELEDIPRISPVAEIEPTKLGNVDLAWLSSRRLQTALAVFSIAQIIWLWPLLDKAVLGGSSPVPLRSLVERLGKLGEGDLPNQIGIYKFEKFKTELRGKESSFGEFSREWHYRSGRVPAIASVDFPFRGWHELTDCYTGLGWILKDRTVQTDAAEAPSEPGAGTRVEAVFERQPGRFGALIFGLDDSTGIGLEPPETQTPIGLGERFDLFSYPARRLGPLVDRVDPALSDSYQVQLFVVTEAPLSPAEWTEARALYTRVRDEFRRRLRPAVASENKGGNS